MKLTINLDPMVASDIERLVAGQDGGLSGLVEELIYDYLKRRAELLYITNRYNHPPYGTIPLTEHGVRESLRRADEDEYEHLLRTAAESAIGFAERRDPVENQPRAELRDLVAG